jgi:hypothetical protein
MTPYSVVTNVNSTPIPQCKESRTSLGMTICPLLDGLTVAAIIILTLGKTIGKNLGYEADGVE